MFLSSPEIIILGTPYFNYLFTLSIRIIGTEYLIFLSILNTNSIRILNNNIKNKYNFPIYLGYINLINFLNLILILLFLYYLSRI